MSIEKKMCGRRPKMKRGAPADVPNEVIKERGADEKRDFYSTWAVEFTEGSVRERGKNPKPESSPTGEGYMVPGGGVTQKLKDADPVTATQKEGWEEKVDINCCGGVY